VVGELSGYNNGKHSTKIRPAGSNPATCSTMIEFLSVIAMIAIGFFFPPLWLAILLWVAIRLTLG
jgi:hypothetical protein